MSKPTFFTIAEARDALRSREISAVELAQAHLDAIEKARGLNAFVTENPDIWDQSLKDEITACCKTIVGFEDKFIDLAFEQGEVEGLTPQEVKDYIRYIGDRRLQQLNPLFHVRRGVCRDNRGEIRPGLVGETGCDQEQAL